MTDEELAQAVAEKVMGWKWMRWEDYRKLYEKNPVIAEEYKGYWVWVTKENKLPTPRGEFNLNEPRHWMIVVERMREGFDYAFDLRVGAQKYDEWCATFYKKNVFSGYSSTPGRSIYEAALKAEGGGVK